MNSNVSYLISMGNLSNENSSASLDWEELITLQAANDPFERVAFSPVNKNMTLVVKRSTSSTIQNGLPVDGVISVTLERAIPSPIWNGRRTRMNKSPYNVC